MPAPRPSRARRLLSRPGPRPPAADGAGRCRPASGLAGRRMAVGPVAARRRQGYASGARPDQATACLVLCAGEPFHPAVCAEIPLAVAAVSVRCGRAAVPSGSLCRDSACGCGCLGTLRPRRRSIRQSVQRFRLRLRLSRYVAAAPPFHPAVCAEIPLAVAAVSVRCGRAAVPSGSLCRDSACGCLLASRPERQVAASVGAGWRRAGASLDAAQHRHSTRGDHRGRRRVLIPRSSRWRTTCSPPSGRCGG